MCGISGFTGDITNKENILASMMEEMKHRGPDSAGKHIGSKIALGFRRLSIIDLENGTQPMRNEDGNLTLVFNGEIYNFQDLRRELEQQGHVFATRSDSETLLHGYERYGEDLPDHLRGMFAFVLWDEAKETLFAARDFFGIKPFYYAVVDGNLVFASEIKSILKFPGCPRVLNREALEQYLSFQYSPLNETFFKGIYKLPPGSCLTYKDGALDIRQYFDPLLSPKKAANDALLIDRMDKVLKDSITRHMVSDVEIGAFLSGGVDSGYIAANFSGHKAFTVGFLNRNNHYSEINLAGKTAAGLGLAHHTKVISRDEFWDSVPDVMYHLDEPSGDAAAVALYFVAREASRHVKVVTSGEGADELFGGYNIYLEPHALKILTRLPGCIRRSLGRLAQKLPDVKGKNYLIRASMDVEERFIGNACIFKDKEKKALLRSPTDSPSSAELLTPMYQKAAHLKDMNKMQYIDLTNWLPGDILQKADKMTMAHSLELRVPFLDRDVFELARHLPENAKIRKHKTKYLFRKVAERYLPHEDSARKKLGFPVPIRLWLKEEPWYREVKTAFTGETASELFHTEKLVELLDEHKAGKRDNSRKIWTVYAFLIWHRIFLEPSAHERSNL